jgi:hypothetical protein
LALVVSWLAKLSRSAKKRARNKRLGRGYRVRLPNRGVGNSNRGWLVFAGQLVHKSVQFDNEF